MNELVKLRQQIAEMEKQAAKLQKKNHPAVVAELRQQMAAYGITVEELSRPAAKSAKPGGHWPRRRVWPKPKNQPCLSP